MTLNTQSPNKLSSDKRSAIKFSEVSEKEHIVKGQFYEDGELREIEVFALTEDDYDNLVDSPTEVSQQSPSEIIYKQQSSAFASCS